MGVGWGEWFIVFSSVFLLLRTMILHRQVQSQHASKQCFLLHQSQTFVADNLRPLLFLNHCLHQSKCRIPNLKHQQPGELYFYFVRHRSKRQPILHQFPRQGHHILQQWYLIKVCKVYTTSPKTK